MTDSIYRVSLTSGFSSVQAAISQVVLDLVLLQSNSQPVTGDYIIEVEDGVYPAFKVPAGLTKDLIGGVFKLIIRSADPNSYFPVIDFNRSTFVENLPAAGADIEEFNPNIVIEGIKFQYFPVGIRAVQNCHNLKINKCVCQNNRNVGILVENSANVQLLQNVILNGDYGIVARLCKNAALIHNTIFLNGSISTNVGEANAAIWAQLSYDYGNGISDSGRLHLLGNIAWNTVGPTLSFLLDDLERAGAIVSNFNDFVVGSPDKFIVIESRGFQTAGNSNERFYINSLARWKDRGFDQNSISEDPRFISSQVSSPGRSKHIIDLSIFSDSPVRGLVPTFYEDAVSTATWLPSYVASGDLQFDILGNARLAGGASIGANDKGSSSGFFGSDLLVSPLGDSDNTDCGVTPLSDIINKNYDLWYPKYKAGFFYSNDREFYLYSRKECRFIGELAVTKFILPGRVDLNFPISAIVNGDKINANQYLDILGDEIHLYHKDLNISTGDEEIEFRYTSTTIEGGDQASRNRVRPSLTYSSLVNVSSVETFVVFKIKEGQTRYFLPKNYVAKGPVVITDDRSYPTNSDLVTNREFAVEWDQAYQQAEIIFHKNLNLTRNSNFDYSNNFIPVAWASSGAYAQSGFYPNYSIAGTNVCVIEWSGYLSQDFPVTSGSSIFSWYAHTDIVSEGIASLKFYDGHNRDLGYKKEISFIPTKSWHRYFIQIGQTGDTAWDKPDLDYPHVPLSGVIVPDNAEYVKIEISSPVTGNIYLDAVQYEHNLYPSYYHRKPYGFEMTVEFETSDEEYYIDYGRTMASSVTTQNDGFLYIPEIPASAFNGPYSAYVTTLHEWRWPQGRKYLLPWARLGGKDKLRKRPKKKFHAYPQPVNQSILPVNFMPGVEKIEITPDPVIIKQGEPNGISFSIVASDKNGNPFADAYFRATIQDARQKFPGWLHRKFYGAKQQLGQTVFGKLDASGSAALTWIPPADSNVSLSIKVPKPTSTADSGQSISVIPTRYPVSPTFNGNVIILDNLGNVLTSESTPIYGFYRAYFSADQSTVTTEYPIKAGSVKVLVDNKELQETFINLPESDQFYVDYENGFITLKGKVDIAYIQYLPSYTFVDQTDLYKIIVYHDKLFKGYDNQITVCHDSITTLTVDVLDYTVNYYRSVQFDLVSLNALSSREGTINKAYLEI